MKTMLFQIHKWTHVRLVSPLRSEDVNPKKVAQQKPINNKNTVKFTYEIWKQCTLK